MAVHLITYGDKTYKKQRIAFKHVSEYTGFFDSVKVFTRKNLGKLFKAKFLNILNEERGGGYWVWKPYIIKKAFDQLNEDDILIYCDVGCFVNLNGKTRYKEYLEILKKSKYGCLAFETCHNEYKYTKQEVFEYFNCNKDIKINKQLVGGILLFKKCSHAAFLINKWMFVLNNVPELFTDQIDASKQHINFIDHRHDQSVFSIIRRVYGSEFINDETHFDDFIRDGNDYPFWAARLK